MRFKPAFHEGWAEKADDSWHDDKEKIAIEVVNLLASHAIPVWKVDHILFRASCLAGVSPLAHVTS